MYEIHPEKGLINRGNFTRIKNVMKKARRGEPVSTLFLGGSITQGSLSSKQELCYASLVHAWWVKKFPQSNVRLINAGIGGTTSQFGVSRVRQHVLTEKPDFVLTEFAVNDDNTEFFKETYESLVRVLLKDEKKIGLMLMNNVRFDDGINAEDMHLEIAKRYDVPMVSMKATIWPAICDKTINAPDITPDFLHPNDAGHELVASVIINFLEKVYAELDEEEAPAGYDTDVTSKEIKLPSPITSNMYEESVRIKSYNMSSAHGVSVKCDGFKPDTNPKKEFLDIFSQGFSASKVGDSIEFTADCTGLALQYQKTIHLPAPVAKAVVDGDEANAIVLDANFDETWGDCLYIETIARHLDKKKHTVKITITETHENDQRPFYLVSCIASN